MKENLNTFYHVSFVKPGTKRFVKNLAVKFFICLARSEVKMISNVKLRLTFIRRRIECLKTQENIGCITVKIHSLDQ